MQPDLASQPDGFPRRFGEPVGAAVFAGPFGANVSMYIYEDSTDWVYASGGLEPVLGVELSGRAAKTEGESGPSRFVPELVRGLATALSVVGTRPEHGHVELVLGSDDGEPLHALFVWDTEVDDAVGRVLRVMRITEAEATALNDISVGRFVHALERELGGLTTDVARGDAFTPEQFDRLRRDHPRRGPESIHVPVVSWSVVDDTAYCQISEQAASVVRAWAKRGSVLTVRGPTQSIAFRRGEPSLRAEAQTLFLSLPGEVLQQAILPNVVRIPGLELRCCAMGVTPTREPTSVVRHPPERDAPRLHHYAFAYKMLPANVAGLRLAAPGSTTRLTQAWSRMGEMVASSPEVSFLPPVARGLVPGTRTHGVVGLGVVSVEEIAGWTVAIAQMPLTEAATEAFYVAVAERRGLHRLLSWERTEEGLAILGEWWAAGDEYECAHADFGGSGYVGAFREAIARWLVEHPRAVSESGDLSMSDGAVRPRQVPRRWGGRSAGFVGALLVGLVLWWVFG